MRRSLLRPLLAPLLTIAAVSLLAAGGASAQQTQVGIASAIVGDVRMSSPAAPSERKIARKQRIAWGDIIRTRKKSQLHIMLLDRSTFSIGERARVVIDRYIYDPNEGRSFFGRVIEGAFRFLSGSNNANSTATIDTPTGTIGIRGTALDGIVGEEAKEIAEDEPAIPDNTDHDEDTATLVVLRGPGAATEGGLTVGLATVSAAGKTVTLDQPMLAAYIPRRGAQPIGPFRISASGLSELQDELQPSVARANGGGFGLGGILAGAAALAGAVLVLTGDDDPPDPVNDNDNDDTAGRGQQPID